MQPECISQRASSGRLNCSCSRSRDLTAINPVVPEMMKIAALAVSTAPPGGNMSFAFSKSVPIAPAKGRGKRTPAWTNRRAKALVPCGFADAKTAKGILQYQNSRKRLSNCPRIPREEVRKYGSFQSGAKYGIYRYEQPPLAKQGIVLKGKGLVVANAFAARRLGLYPCGLIPYQPGEDRAQSAKRSKNLKKPDISSAAGNATRKDVCAVRSYVIYEQPQPKEPEAATSSEQPPTSDLPTLENPTLDNPTLEKPTLEKPTLENPTQLNKDISLKNNQLLILSSTHSIPFPFPKSLALLSRTKRLRRRKGKERKRKQTAQ